MKKTTLLIAIVCLLICANSCNKTKEVQNVQESQAQEVKAEPKADADAKAEPKIDDTNAKEDKKVEAKPEEKQNDEANKN